MMKKITALLSLVLLSTNLFYAQNSNYDNYDELMVANHNSFFIKMNSLLNESQVYIGGSGDYLVDYQGCWGLEPDYWLIKIHLNSSIAFFELIESDLKKMINEETYNYLIHIFYEKKWPDKLNGEEILKLKGEFVLLKLKYHGEDSEINEAIRLDYID